MSALLSTAEITRRVRAACKGLPKGVPLGGVEVEFSPDGLKVRVLTAADSIPPAPARTGGVSVEDVRKDLAKRHAARRP